MSHHFSTGNELTPSSKYDFKFKDYAPWVFRHLREDFHIDASDYLVSLSSRKPCIYDEERHDTGERRELNMDRSVAWVGE